jgi:hypothetical protein
MLASRAHKGWAATIAVALILGLAALAGVAGCGGEESALPPRAGQYTDTTAGAMTSTTWAAAEYDQSEAAATDSFGYGTDQAMAGTLTALEAASGQKIISDAQLEIEVEQGKFQTVFDQALLLADRYGGYLVSSNSYASGEENSMKSGTVAIRVPSSSFTKAVSDASKLGTLKNQSLSTQDVTEEYVDLEARIKNSEAYVESMIALFGKAQTVDEILQVQSVLNYAQEDLEALKGRMRYLEEHTSYSTITMSIYETGVEVTSGDDWGFVAALKDGLRNIVKAFNAIIRGLGVLIPVLIVLGIIAWIVYLIARAILRRNRAREQARYQAYPQGWSGQPFQGAPSVPGGAGAQPNTGDEPKATP